MSPTFHTIGVHLLSNGIRADIVEGTYHDGRVVYWLSWIDHNGYAVLSVPQVTCPRIDHL